MYSLIIVIFHYCAESGGLLFPIIMTCKITDQCTKVDSTLVYHSITEEKYYLPEKLVVGGDCNKS